MFFKNLTFFRFPASFSGLFPTPVEAAFDDLAERLAECKLQPIGALEMHARGFVSPLGHGEEVMAHRIGACAWVTLGGEDKILPPAVVNSELTKRLKVIEEREGRSPGGRARKRLKDDILHELLPRAFAKPGRCDAYFDFDRHFIAVDASARARAEQVVSEIRRAAGSFPAVPLMAQTAVRGAMTCWLAGEALPDGFALGESCELRGSDDMRVTIRNIDLGGEEIAAHLEAGLQCTRLALVFEDRLAFELDEALVIRKLAFLDGCIDELESSERDDLRAELDARFALMAGEVGRLFDRLDDAFRFQAAGDESAAAAGPKRSRKAMGAAAPPKVDPVPPGTDIDPMYDAAVRVVTETQRASIAGVQRRLKIGYNRAARLIETMESCGVVSRPGADGNRTVLSRGTLQ